MLVSGASFLRSSSVPDAVKFIVGVRGPIWSLYGLALTANRANCAVFHTWQVGTIGFLILNSRLYLL
jgi:hypothetical protein